jgi:eukaryotic-like serine/threonine-protein kinase
LHPGTLLQGRFEIERQIGAGGMGLVFRANDRLDGCAVAVKVLRGDHPTEVARFERAIRLLAELHHPEIVRYVAHGQSPDGEPFLVMEWLEGEDLRQRLARQRLTLGESLSIVRCASAALAVAHARGLVHRDIKPSNLFLVGGSAERVRVLDFDLARLVKGEDPLTAPGTIVGTPGYLAPEQAKGLPVRHACADVFSLGCVLYECLTGRRAFKGADIVAVLAKVQIQEVPSVRTIRPDLPDAVSDLVSRMMARAPEARLQDAAEVAHALDTLGDLDGTRDTRESRAHTGEPTSWTSEPASGAQPEPGSGALVAPSLRSALTLSEQRVVSVLLASTDGAPLSPQAQALAAIAVERHGGHLDVLQSGVMLVTTWGAGSALDRAGRAGLSALALLEHVPGAAVCVVTGRGVVSEHVAGGNVLDRGAETLRATLPGSVRLDPTTAEMLGRRFVVEPSGDAFILIRERDRQQAASFLLGKLTPFIGRNTELSLLEAELAGCLDARAAAAVLVTGEAGSGKSRLCRELCSDIERRFAAQVIAGRADSLGERAPLGIAADAIRDAAGIHDGEPLALRRQKLAARLGRHLAGPTLARACAFLGEMASIPFPDETSPALRAARGNAQIMGDAMRAAWHEWLAAECEAGPVVLVLEDLHWGDLATIRLVDATLRNLRDLPLLVVGLGRPEIHARFPALFAGQGSREIKLGPLGRKPSVELVSKSLGKDASVDLVARVVEHANGNPFYLEELVRAVARGRDDTFPDSVLGTVEARLDAEGVEAKRVLRAASVFGERFSMRGVAALLGGEHPQGETQGALVRLAARELIAPRPEAPPGDAHFVFCHALLREAAYAMLTDDDRALGHRLAGAWLEAGGSTDAQALAEHFVRGGEPARAVRWYVRSAEQALAADDLGEALTRAQKGCLCGAAGEALGALRLVEAEAHVWRGEIQLAEDRACEASALFSPGSAGWFRCLYQEVVAAGKLGHVDRVEDRFAGARGTAAHPGAEGAEASYLCACASNLVFGGRYAAADQAFAALSVRAPSDALSVALIHQSRSFLASARGDSGACLEGLRAALDAFEQAEDRRNACMARVNLGFVQAELGAFEDAEDALRLGLRTADRMGLHDVAAIARNNLGHVLGCRGRLDEARRLQEQSIEALRLQRASREEGLGRTYLAQIELRAGEPVAAEREALAAAEVLVAMPPLHAFAVAVLARALLAQGRLDEALEAAVMAAAVLASLGSIEEGDAMVRLVHAEALAALGMNERYAAAVSEARDHLLVRAARISDPRWRERFLTSVPDNARTLELAQPLSRPSICS